MFSCAPWLLLVEWKILGAQSQGLGLLIFIVIDPSQAHALWQALIFKTTPGPKPSHLLNGRTCQIQLGCALGATFEAHFEDPKSLGSAGVSNLLLFTTNSFSP